MLLRRTARTRPRCRRRTLPHRAGRARLALGTGCVPCERVVLGAAVLASVALARDAPPQPTSAVPAGTGRKAGTPVPRHRGRSPACSSPRRTAYRSRVRHPGSRAKRPGRVRPPSGGASAGDAAVAGRKRTKRIRPTQWRPRWRPRPVRPRRGGGAGRRRISGFDAGVEAPREARRTLAGLICSSSSFSSACPSDLGLGPPRPLLSRLPPQCPLWGRRWLWR